ncbi:Uncharacterised protein [Edwardsiella hoshinae]|uniref:Uncharacterized protein n=1 Tax=Edwardsiella hoshinae TaxID=93378 RepID=A0A376DJ73_9GAMM|nr:Uncharacterised protein [Edwardsiella hoshinae]
MDLADLMHLQCFGSVLLLSIVINEGYFDEFIHF